MQVVAVDIGGTNARFALAEVSDGGVVRLAEPVTLKTADYASMKQAWDAFEQTCGGTVPRRVSIAIAGPVANGLVQMTNCSWIIQTDKLAQQLGIDDALVINDFAAVAHAVAHVPPERLTHLSGPERTLPKDGVITVLGPGTGLGVAQLHCTAFGYRVVPTEGGHISFSPTDAVEDAILHRLRQKYGRVSTERVNSGPGITEIYAVLSDLAGHPADNIGDITIWQRGLAGTDSLAAAAVDRFCKTLGTLAGDLALAHNADAVVLAGGLGYRLREVLPRSDFAQRFTEKGRFSSKLAGISVSLITHPQPGLFGAAAAYARDNS